MATYVLIAVAVVLIYAPWGLALRPWDAELLRAGFSIIAAIALAGVFGTSTYLALKDPDVKLLEPTKVLSVEEVEPVLEEYREAPVVGEIATEALEQIHSAARKRERLRKVIGIQFSEGSMSWDRFCDLVDTAQRTVLRNSALVANNVQSFDRDAYIKAQHAGAKQSEHLALYDQSLAEMQEILAANEREADDTREEAGQTIEELQGLIEETRYYR